MDTDVPDSEKRVTSDDSDCISQPSRAYVEETNVLEKREKAMVYAHALWECRKDARSERERDDLVATLRVLGEEFAQPLSKLVLDGTNQNEVALRAYRIASGLLWQTRGAGISKYDRHRSLAVVDSLIRWGLPHASDNDLAQRFRELCIEWSIVLGDFDRARTIARTIVLTNPTT